MNLTDRTDLDAWVMAALDEARTSVTAGGMPFGALLVIDGQIVSAGHNRQIQDTDILAHAEMLCLSSFLRGKEQSLSEATLIATEAPCPMCAGAAVVAGIKKIVIGEMYHFRGAYEWLIDQGVDVTILNDQDCIDVVTEFRNEHPERWSRFSAGE